MDDEDIDAIIDEWLLEWKVPVSIDELSDREAIFPPDIPIEKEKMKDSDEVSQEESSVTLSDLELERK